jgi:outer membrane protein assembly factor BamB
VTVCLTGVVAGRATRGTELRFDAGTGTPLPSLVFSSTPVGRSVGVGLFDPGLRKPEYLVAAEGAHVSWREPLAKIFTLPGASTDWGWYFERVERDGIFVGSPGWAPIARSGATGFDDLARTMTAGFRIRDGRVVWRNRGTTYICNYLPCAESVGVRLRSYGTMFISLTGGSLPVASPKSTVSVEGFDLATGRTRWSFDAGHDPGLSSQTLLPPVAGKSAILVHDRAGRLIRLDLRDGSHRRAASSSVGWCRSPLSYREEVAYPAGGFATTTYYGQNAIYACDGRRRHVARPATVPGYLGSLGARVGALVAWTSTTGAVVAAPA